MEIIHLTRSLKAISKALRLASPRERRIFVYRWGLSSGIIRTLEETGKKYGVTRERIRQIELKVFENAVAVENSLDNKLQK